MNNTPTSGRPSDRARRVFIDMDGVVVDFDAYKTACGLTGDEVKKIAGAYLDMDPIPGAIEAVRSLIGMGYEVWMATKPPTGVPHAYSDKAAWVMRHLPELKRRIIVTHDKGLLGNERDFLCDDRPHKANCEQFAGTLLRFVDGYHWPEALRDLREARELDAAHPVADEAVDEPIGWVTRYLVKENWSKWAWHGTKKSATQQMQWCYDDRISAEMRPVFDRPLPTIAAQASVSEEDVTEALRLFWPVSWGAFSTEREEYELNRLRAVLQTDRARVAKRIAAQKGGDHG